MRIGQFYVCVLFKSGQDEHTSVLVLNHIIFLYNVNHVFYLSCHSLFIVTIFGKINIPPHSGGYFIFGHSPNITGCAQVRFLLACQPCICYLLPVNGFPFFRSPLSNTFSVSYSLPCVKGGGTAPAVTEGLWLHCFSSILLSSQSPTALRAEPPLHKGAFSLRRVFLSLKLF